MALQAKDRLGPYEIVALLGVGGMGEVYRGRDTRLGRDVALKVISPKRLGDDDLRRRFELEARAASVLNHPSIVTIYDVGDTDGVAWIAMEWVEGRTLRQALLEADGPLPLRDCLTIARQVADGLAAAHARGVVHRDLKPENIMLAPDGRSKILDFGLARQSVLPSLEGSGSGIETMAGFPNAQTFEGTVLGTVGYMSPEQASGKPVDFRSDQFALGLIVYEMVTGRRAFSRPTAVETLAAVIREEPAPPATLRTDVPRALEALIARCLAKRPEDRFASTRELAAALESLGQGLASGSFAATEIAVAPPSATRPPVLRRLLPRRATYVLGAIVALALAATAWMRFHSPAGTIDSLAVLPFENASKDPETEYLGDGIAESLISQMSRVPSLRVMARATVFRFKGTSDPQEAGRKLGVGAVLTGSVSRRGDRLLISAELMEIATGARRWGEKYDRPFADLLRVQDSIVSGISDGLRLRLSQQQKRTLGLHGTENAEAYELSLKARYFLLKDTEEGYIEARRLYLQALEKDPGFAEAHLGVSITYGVSAVNGYMRPAEAWPRSDAEARKALDLDPGSTAARLQFISRKFFFDWDWAGTDQDFRQLGGNPGGDPRLLAGEAFRPIGLSLWARGRTEEAVALMERALRVDPGNLPSRITMGDYLAQAGRLEEAIHQYRTVLEADPSDPRPLFGIAEILRRRGDTQGAIDALRKAYELSGEEEGAKALATAHTEGEYENAEVAVARLRLANLEALAKERYVSPLDLARLNAQVGEREKAFSTLEAALAERSGGLVLLKVDRAWDRIRDDPRFAALVRRVGIP
jgi:TolB-like protein/tetratricopeptide (TPR) repeat protein/tRNA A-37 threonylcarbamoyl transferase component Bud32